MKTYDMVCPVCGTKNRNLYLEETDGWMECEKCHETVRFERSAYRIPRREQDVPKDRNRAMHPVMA